MYRNILEYKKRVRINNFYLEKCYELSLLALSMSILMHSSSSCAAIELQVVLLTLHELVHVTLAH